MISGDGEGYGDGSGDGFGFGSGDGFGDGFGFGFGSGDGNGDGQMIERILNGFGWYRKCKYEVDIYHMTSDFKISTHSLGKTARGIWVNPSKYSGYEKGSQNMLENFHKKLIIRYPGGTEEKFFTYAVRVGLTR